MALLKTKVVTQYPPKSWLNIGITQQKLIVQNRECIFKKYVSDPNWQLALKVERQILHNTIYLAKKCHISDLVVSCRNDFGKLYKLVNHLMGASQKIHYLMRIQKVWLKNMLISFLIKLQP